MKVSYAKLWHKLLDLNMNKSELKDAAGISWSAVSKLTNNENINTKVLLKICNILHCDISDIVEFELERD